MNSYLVETDDFTAPINYNILVGGIRSKYGHGQYQKRYFHIIVTSGSMVIASTNPAISKTYPSQDIIAYYKQKTLKDLRIFTFGKYKYKTYLEVIKSDPEYVKWCLQNIQDFSLTADEHTYLSYWYCHHLRISYKQ